MVEEVLLVLERLRTANVLEQEVREGGRDHVSLLGGQLDLRLTTVVDDEDRPMAVVHLDVGRRQEVEL